MAKAKQHNTAHYSPPEVARRVASGGILPLLKAGLYPGQIKVVDPCCGDGALLVAAHEILVKATLRIGFGEPRPLLGVWGAGDPMSRTEAANAVVSCLRGTDIDEASVAATRQRLSALCEDGQYADVEVCDALMHDWGETRANCVLMNPPYLTGGKISSAFGADYLRRLKERYPHHSGHADLAADFLVMANSLYEGNYGPHTMSFVATNTISQGDSRVAGLYPLIDDFGWDVRRAQRNEPWPGEAKVMVTYAVLSRGLPLGHVPGQMQSWLRKVPAYDMWLAEPPK